MANSGGSAGAELVDYNLLLLLEQLVTKSQQPLLSRLWHLPSFGPDAA